MILKSLSIVGSDSCTASELRAVFEFMERKGIRPNIFKTFSLVDVISAHKLLQDRNAQGRTVLKISDVWNWWQCMRFFGAQLRARELSPGFLDFLVPVRWDTRCTIWWNLDITTEDQPRGRNAFSFQGWRHSPSEQLCNNSNLVHTYKRNTWYTGLCGFIHTAGVNARLREDQKRWTQTSLHCLSGERIREYQSFVQ